MRGVEIWKQPISMLASALMSIRVLSVAGIAAIIFIALAQNPPARQSDGVAAADVGTSTRYTFNAPGTLNETGSIENSRSPYWWLDSGGLLIIRNGIGETIQGDIDKTDRWYKQYAASNPSDTDGGINPQNIFRLVSRSLWDNVRTEASFKIIKDNLSASLNRNESNGILLMSRYVNGQTLYYAGIRVDGSAVIKKKYNGTYYTMAQEQLFSGHYDRNSDTSLLPKGTWVRLRMETITKSDGSVSVSLYIRDEDKESWKLLVSEIDSAQYAGTPPITGRHPIGVRSDFMDMQFDDILIEKI